MPAGRPDIPAELKRRLLVEAGHRCAITACRTVSPLHFEHIEDWAKVKKHEFENMIVLCANCHGRKGNGPGQIDRKALRQYKANLGVVNGRYSDLERRVLEVFAEHRVAFAKLPEPRRDVAVRLHNTMRPLMMYLLKDGIVEFAPPGTDYVDAYDGAMMVRASPLPVNDIANNVEYYRLTGKGHEFIEALVGARPLADEPT